MQGGVGSDEIKDVIQNRLFCSVKQDELLGRFYIYIMHYLVGSHCSFFHRGVI